MEYNDPCVYTFEKKIQEIQKLILSPWPDPRYKSNIDLFIGGDISKAVNYHGSWIGKHKSWRQLTCLQGNQTSITHRDGPTKPFKSKLATSDQMNSGKNPRRRKHHFSALVFWGRGSGSGVRSNSPTHPTKELPLFLPRTPYIEGGSDSLEWFSPPRI